ncbi:MAG: AraC family ligand binding domain-containing protein [Alphaproteobacteria bacterium]|nr:AraC family ligand binding domain-containing protein [Alphaproteobacteria bacterium SS10]
MTKAVPQSETVDTDRLQGGEKAHFWRRHDYDNLECLSANFTDHQYDLHTHDTFAFGVITAGTERFMCDGREYVAKPGQLCLVHPGQVHDGGPADSGFTYRMFYPSVSLRTNRAYELRDGRDDMPTFANPVIDDPILADIAVELHKRLEAQPDSMAIDQALEQMLAMLIDRQMATEDW